MRRMNAARRTTASKLRSAAVNPARHSRYAPTSKVVQFGSTVHLRVDPALGKAENSCISEIGVTGVVTVGMRASFKCHVRDAFGNETSKDETGAFHVAVRPLSSHLPRDLVVATSVQWRGRGGLHAETSSCSSSVTSADRVRLMRKSSRPQSGCCCKCSRSSVCIFSVPICTFH